MREEEVKNLKSIVFVSTETKRVSTHTNEWVHSTKNNQWTGWYCAAGTQTLYIDFDGNVFIGTCGVGGWYGNLFREGLNPDKKLNQWVKCTAKSCPCGADMMAPKVKNEKNIPAQMSELFRSFEPGAEYTLSEDLVSPDLVISEATKNRKLVIWDIGRRCNYNCSYCFADSHNQYESHKSLGSLKHAVDGLHNWWAGGLPTLFNITGGEPTLNPQYLEFVQYAKTKQVGNLIHTTTNGSRDSKFFQELIKYSSITFSAHLESLADPKTYKRFVENIEACTASRKAKPHAAGIFFQVRVMIKPGVLELASRLAKDLRAIPDFQFFGQINFDLIHQTADKSAMLNYTQEEIDFASARN